MKKKNNKFMLIALFTLLVVTIGATYAYFSAQKGSGSMAEINTTSGTTDSLTFETGGEISFTATQDNFGPEGSNVSGETTLKATLLANNTTNTAHFTYNIFLDIDDNDMIYSQDSSKPELLLKIIDPDKEEYTEKIGGLSYYDNVTDKDGVNHQGYDITKKKGPVIIKLDQTIDVENSENPTIQEWTFTVTLINLDADQQANTGKTFNARLTMQSEKRNYLVLDTDDSGSEYSGSKYRSSEYRDKIKNVKFVNYIAEDIDIKEAKWDLSTNEDSSIMGWLENNEDENAPYDLYIGSKEKMYGRDFSNAFSRIKKLETIDFGQNLLDTSLVTDMSDMFSGDINLTNLGDIGGWDTSSVTDMGYMFASTYGLTALDLSDWNTSSVTNMCSMFLETIDLTTLDISSWDTSSVTNMYAMFSGARQLTTLDLSGWDTSSVTDMRRMFEQTEDLKEIGDISGWNTSSVTNMEEMFSYAYDITTLDLSDWDTSSVTNMSYMFSRTHQLTTLDISGWDTSSVTDMSRMFYNSQNLATLKMNKAKFDQLERFASMFDGTPETLQITVNQDGSEWLNQHSEDISLGSRTVTIAE